MNNEIEIKVNTKLQVSDETAIVCLNLLEMYCKDKREGFDPGKIGCKGCTFLNDKFCVYKQVPVC